MDRKRENISVEKYDFISKKNFGIKGAISFLIKSSLIGQVWKREKEKRKLRPTRQELRERFVNTTKWERSFKLHEHL